MGPSCAGGGGVAGGAAAGGGPRLPAAARARPRWIQRTGAGVDACLAFLEGQKAKLEALVSFVASNAEIVQEDEIRYTAVGLNRIKSNLPPVGIRVVAGGGLDSGTWDCTIHGVFGEPGFRLDEVIEASGWPNPDQVLKRVIDEEVYHAYLRIPVATVVDMVAEGLTTAEILAAYPDLEEADLREALRYAAEAVRERELPLVPA